MDSLEINKIVAGLLVVVLIIIGITNFAEIFENDDDYVHKICKIFEKFAIF